MKCMKKGDGVVWVRNEMAKDMAKKGWSFSTRASWKRAKKDRAQQ